MRWFVVMMLAAACGKGTFEIKSNVKRDDKSVEGLLGDNLPDLSAAKPKLEVTGISNHALSSAMETAIAKSPRAHKGAITVAVSDAPSVGSGTGNVTLVGHAVFAHAPRVTVADASFMVHLDYKHATADNLGAALGEPVAQWVDALKLPANLGVPGPAAPVVAVAAGITSCSLHDDGTVRCWQSGRGAVPIDVRDTTAIAGAANFGTCGVRNNGTAWCMDAWDSSLNLEVRDVCDLHDAAAISVAQATACVVTKDGQVTCWPRDEAAFAPCKGDHQPMTAKLAKLANVTSLYVGAFESCALEKDGSVACWENCGPGCTSSARGAVDPGHPPLVNAVKGLAGAKAVGYAAQPCALVDATKIACAATKASHAVTYVSPEPIKALSVGVVLCALTEPGNLYCARGDKLEKREGVADLVSISLGGLESCGVTKSGGVVCWGFGDSDMPKPVALQ